MKKLALLGVGDWGKNYLKTISRRNDCALSCIVSRKTADQLQGIAPHDAQVFEDIDAAQTCIKAADGIIVSSPPTCRPKLLRQLLSAHNSPPILSEKPLTLSYSDTQACVNLARANNTRLIENFIHTYNPNFFHPLQKTYDTFPKYCYSNVGNAGPFRPDYSPLEDYAPHDIAMLLLLYQQKPINISVTIDQFKRFNANAFTAKLDFGEKGNSTLKISNLITNKQRYLRIKTIKENWVFDDLAEASLTRNGKTLHRPIHPNHTSHTTDPFQTPLDSAIDQLLGFTTWYPDNLLLDLITDTAQVIEELKTQFSLALSTLTRPSEIGV